MNRPETFEELLVKHKDGLSPVYSWGQVFNALLEYTSQDKFKAEESLIQSSVDKRSEILELAADNVNLAGYPLAYKTAALKAMEEYSALCQNELLRQIKIANSDEVITKHWKRQNCFGQYLEGLEDGSKWMRDKFLTLPNIPTK